MTDAHRETVRRAFPEVAEIEDDDLREGVISAWEAAMVDNAIDDLDAIPWFPPSQNALGLTDEWLVPHVRDVTLGAIALADLLAERRSAALSRDLVVAGALVHDVSKPYEFDGHETTDVGRLLGHPHFGVHVVAAAGLPTEVVHVVLSHTPRTAVEPATLEAEIVRRADEVAAAAIRGTAVDDLRDA